MADKDNSIMIALGVDPETGEYKKGSNEGLIGDLAEETKNTIGKEFDQFKEETKKVSEKLPVLTGLKGASEKSGGNLNSQAGLNLMKEIGAVVTDLTAGVQKALITSGGPLEEQLKKTIDLLSSDDTEKQDQALDKMEMLQKAMSVDFEKIAEVMGASVKDLIAARQFQREDNRKKAELQDKIVQERIQVRNELRERGINTYLDKQSNTLKVLTLREEKEVKKEIFKTEKELIKKIRENEKLIRELRRKETLEPEDNLKIQDLKNEENKAIATLNQRKEEANIKPEEQFTGQGFFTNTYGAAFDQLKNTFDELKFGVKSVVGGFKKVGSSIMGFGSSLSGAKDKIGGFFKSILSGKDGKPATAADKFGALAKAGLAGGLTGGAASAAGGGAAAAGGAGIAAKVGLGGLATAAAPLIGGAAVLGAGAYGLKKLNDKKTREGTIGSSFDESTGEYIPGPEEMNPEFYKNKKITPISKDINVNKMSSDLAAQKESMPAANTVIAPSTSSVVSNNISQTMSMLPNNPDRSFINLNSIPI